jgi:hypothetical protein
MLVHSWGDGAELGPLEPWPAEQFLEMVDRLRGYFRNHPGRPHRPPSTTRDTSESGG